MGDAKHTPGPWHVGEPHPQNACAYVQDSEGHEVATLYGGYDIGADKDADGNWPDQPKRDATAVLISAAPEMLEALRLIAEPYRDVTDAILRLTAGGQCTRLQTNIPAQVAEHVLLARAAIAKAEGR